MAKLAKEATTTRRVLESLFRYFDNGNLWSADHGLAFPVLKDIQVLMESSINEGKYSSTLVLIRPLWKKLKESKLQKSHIIDVTFPRHFLLFSINNLVQ